MTMRQGVGPCLSQVSCNADPSDEKEVSVRIHDFRTCKLLHRSCAGFARSLLMRVISSSQAKDALTFKPYMRYKPTFAACFTVKSVVPGFSRVVGMLAALMLVVGPAFGEEGQSVSGQNAKKTASASKAIQALKAKIAAISQKYPNADQSAAKAKAVQVAIFEFVQNYPELAADAVQAAITELGASKAEVGAIVKAAVEVAPGQAKAIANGAYAVAPDAFAEIQAATPGVTFGPGNPLASPGGGEAGVGAGPGGGSGGNGTGPVVTPPNVTETGFRRR